MDKIRASTVTYRQADNKFDRVFSFFCMLFILCKYDERNLSEETQTRETR